MELLQNPTHGYAFLMEGGDIDELARTLNGGMVRHVPAPTQVPKAKGAVKAFSFHWSNAQAAWDVIHVREYPEWLDGAGFVLFVGRNAMSPTGNLWSQAEMKYVAKKLAHHPGYASSPESAWPRRAASEQVIRGSLIRLAYSKPELRPHLLPLLKTAAPQITVNIMGGRLGLREIPKDPHGQVYDVALVLEASGKRLNAAATAVAQKFKRQLEQMRLHDAMEFIDAEVAKLMPGKRIKWHFYSMPD